MDFFTKKFENLTKGGLPKNITEGGGFDVRFEKQKLGLSISAHKDTRVPVVTFVTPLSEGSKANVERGDVIVGVEGNAVSTYDDVLAVIQALGRPVTVNFQRPGYRANTSKKSSTQNKWGSGTTSGSVSVPSSSSAGSSIFRSRQPAPPPVTEEERRARREAQLAAAENRGAAWDKKVAKKKQEKAQVKKAERERLSEQSTDGPLDEETKAAIERAKQHEQQQAAQLGYNPYQVCMSSNQEARVAVETAQSGNMTASAAPNMGAGHVLGGNPGAMVPPGAVPAPPVLAQEAGADQTNALGEDLEYSVAAGEVEDAIAILMGQGLDASVNAMKTVSKLVKNIIKTPEEEKFRRIRLNNQAFNSKVVSIQGGMELMQAIGFNVDTTGEEPFFVFPESQLQGQNRLIIADQKLQAAMDLLDSQI